MIISNINSTNPSEQAVRRVSDDAPQTVADTSTAKSSPVVKENIEQPSSEQLKDAADTLNQAMRESNQSLEFEFSVDTYTKKTVVRVVDTSTGELVRQIPSKEVLAIARSIDQFQNGLLLSQKA